VALLSPPAALLPQTALPARSRLPQDPSSIRVMSFNIRYGTARDGENRWENRRELLFDLIREQAPDLLGIQEALRFQLDELATAVPGYDEIGVGRDDGRTAGEYAAILYRRSRFEVLESGTFWFSETPDVPGSMDWGNRITRICSWARLRRIGTDRSCYLFNIHLDHQSQPSRERSVELLARRINNRTHLDPIVVTGDFNAGEENRAIRYLTGSLGRASEGTASVAPSPMLRDSFRIVLPDATGVGTFNGFEGRTDGEKIDFVLVDRNWQVLDAAIVTTSREGRYPSDHFPVTAVLVWSPEVRCAPE
jgi:endonuclease/exonuclease/phosphatase family metal-dependent hydrolase